MFDCIKEKTTWGGALRVKWKSTRERAQQASHRSAEQSAGRKKQVLLSLYYSIKSSIFRLEIFCHTDSGKPFTIR